MYHNYYVDMKTQAEQKRAEYEFAHAWWVNVKRAIKQGKRVVIMQKDGCIEMSIEEKK